MATDRLDAYRQLLADTEREINTVQQTIKSLERSLRHLENERTVLRRAVDRRQREMQFRHRAQSALPLDIALETEVALDVIPALTIGDAGSDSWASLNRSDAVERVLKASDTPLDRSQIVKRLVARGRTSETPDDVSATLSYLQRTNRVRQVPPSQWAWVHPRDRRSGRQNQLRGPDDRQAEAERAKETNR